VNASLINSPPSPTALVFDTDGSLWVTGGYGGGILLNFPANQINQGANAMPRYCVSSSNLGAGCQYINNLFMEPEGVALLNGDIWVANNSTGATGTVPGRELIDLKVVAGALTVNATFGNTANATDSPFVCPGGLFATSTHLWVNDESYGESNPQCGGGGDVAGQTGGIFSFTPAQLAAETTIISHVLSFSNITGRPGFGGLFVENDPPSPTELLTVASLNPTVASVAVSPADINGNTNCSTRVTLTYAQDTPVNLTAPATAGGNYFQNWIGCDSVSGMVCSVSMSTDRTLTVLYGSTPPVPTGVKPIPGDGQMGISWDAKQGATSYNLYYSTTPGVTRATGIKIPNVTSTKIVSSLVNNTPYYFVVTSVNAGGESAESVQVAAIPHAATGQKILDGLRITTASDATAYTVYEDSTTSFNATAFWSDGTSSKVVSAWSVSPTTYANISGDGVLTTIAVPTDQAVTISAGYTSGGVTLTTIRNITVLKQSNILTLTISGTGGGSVNSAPSGIAGTSGSYQASFDIGTSVTLTGTPDSISTFAGWNGVCTATSGNCIVAMAADKSVTATFTAAPKAMIGSTSYPTLFAAYSAASNDAVILLLGTELLENLTMDRGIAVSLAGGFNADFSGSNGELTTVESPLTIKTGNLNVNRVIVK
jgi:hypothetical protein